MSYLESENEPFYTKKKVAVFRPLVFFDGFFTKLKITLCKMRIAFRAHILYNILIIRTNRSNT